jgi:hypothetical protein
MKATGSDVDSLRERQNKLMEKLDRACDDKNNQHDAGRIKERKQIIVELSAVGKELGAKIYHEKYNRLENQRLKNEEATAKTARARNKVRREREQLLLRQSAEKLAAAGQKINDYTETDSGHINAAIDNNLKEAREYSEEAAAVAGRRHAEEWKEYHEEKARKRKKQRKINMMV